MKLDNKERIDFINYLLTRAWKNPISRNYKIQIKDIWCNAKCPICEDWTNKWDKEKIVKNLKKVFNEIINEKIKYKYIQILWWEPLIISETLLDIVKAWVKAWIKFDFPTNASLLNKWKIDKLIESWLDSFTFSIDYTSKIHDKWRNLPWAFNKIIDFTNYIQNKWIPVQWNTVIWKFNISEINKFNELYKISFPSIHNFIEIEKNWWESEKYSLDKIEKDKILNELIILRNKNEKINIINNWFKQININNNYAGKCYIPIKLKSYIINENSIKFSPCYQEFEENLNIKEFSKNAIIKWCNLCNSSYKENYNNYMSELIKKYKLSNK